MDYLKIGSFLQALRKAKGITQAELAEYFGVSPKTVSKWECGEALPEIPLLQALAEYYEVTIDEILKGKRLPQEGNEKVHQQNQKYFFNRKMKQNKLIFLIAMSVLAMGFMLFFVLNITTLPNIAFGVGIAIYLASFIVLLIGFFCIGNWIEGFDEEIQIEYSKLRRKLWIGYSFFLTGVVISSIFNFIMIALYGPIPLWLFLLICLVIFSMVAYGYAVYLNKDGICRKNALFVSRFHFVFYGIWIAFFLYLMFGNYIEVFDRLIHVFDIDITNAFQSLNVGFPIGFGCLIICFIGAILSTIKKYNFIPCYLGMFVSMIFLVSSVDAYVVPDLYVNADTFYNWAIFVMIIMGIFTALSVGSIIVKCIIKHKKKKSEV